MFSREKGRWLHRTGHWVPQIEVTFDIDANGIVHVSAKDLGTGKEQHIRIETSSGLSEEEINRMVKDAEANAEADKREKEKVEVKNNADAMIYSTEKSLKELGDKLSDAEKQAINDSIAALKKSLEGDNVEDIKEKTEALQKASYKLAEELYKQNPQGAGANPGSGPEQNGQTGGDNFRQSNSGSADDVDYEVVDDDK